jgi:hypothetical protein
MVFAVEVQAVVCFEPAAHTVHAEQLGASVVVE